MSVYSGVLYPADPPEGIERDPNQKPEAAVLTIVTGITFALSTLSIITRLYGRIILIKKFAFDDFLMLLAYICNIIMVVFVLDMLRFGLGKHMWNVPITDLYPEFSIRNLLAAIFFCAATGLAKGSILLFYLRIFPGRYIVITVWSLFAFVIGYSLAGVFANIFSCNPVSASWSLEDAATAVCMNRPAFYFAQAALGIFTDIATVLTPVPLLKGLQLRTRRKVGVALVLTLGGFVCVVSIIRLQSLTVLLNSTDLTNNTVLALMWCVLELNLSIVGGSMPAMKPVLQKYFPRLLASTQGASDSGNYYMDDTRSKPKRSRITDPYNISRDRDSKSDSDSERRIVNQVVGGKSVEGGVMGASWTVGDHITKTVEYGYQVSGDEGTMPQTTHQDEEAQMVRGRSPPRI
ncbi:hypothetical protein MBLNU13_g06774t1 [Cladosporium sp. NU13]